MIAIAVFSLVGIVCELSMLGWIVIWIIAESHAGKSMIFLWPYVVAATLLGLGIIGGMGELVR